jgi:membrane protein required for colicin V production
MLRMVPLPLCEGEEKRMTVFDLIALAVVGWSALSGFNRGAAAELLGLFAMAISAMVTIGFLPATAPMARHILHAGWISAVIAAVVTFAVVFVFLRLVAATITNSLHHSPLGGVNRLAGLLFGVLRGVVFLGLFALVFNRATPETLKPRWITASLAYPAAGAAGRALQGVLPKRFDGLGGFGGALTQTIKREGAQPDGETPDEETSDRERPLAPAPKAPTSERAKGKEHGYTRRARDSVDALVERTR